jgi:hypothetical protein
MPLDAGKKRALLNFLVARQLADIAKRIIEKYKKYYTQFLPYKNEENNNW